MNLAARWFLVLVLVVSIGAHTAVIQSAAWVSMALSYTLESGSIAKGLSDTFDGEHPCALCHLAQEAEKHEKTPAGVDAQQMKLHLALVDLPLICFQNPPPLIFPPSPAEQCHTRALTPAIPPPRQNRGMV